MPTCLFPDPILPQEKLLMPGTKNGNILDFPMSEGFSHVYQGIYHCIIHHDHALHNDDSPLLHPSLSPLSGTCCQSWSPSPHPHHRSPPLCHHLLLPNIPCSHWIHLGLSQDLCPEETYARCGCRTLQEKVWDNQYSLSTTSTTGLIYTTFCSWPLASFESSSCRRLTSVHTFSHLLPKVWVKVLKYVHFKYLHPHGINLPIHINILKTNKHGTREWERVFYVDNLYFWSCQNKQDNNQYPA